MENNFVKAIASIQSTLNAPKNQYNSFGKYAYRSCEDILSAVKPLLLEKGLVLTLSDSVVMVGDRYYIKATAIVSDGKNELVNEAYAREDESKKGMDGSQITGTASSYARKYALNGLFAIDDSKDADTDEHRKTQENAAKAEQTKSKVDCPNCGKEIKSVKKGDKVVSPQEILEKCGGMCTACYKAAMAEKKNKEAEESNNA